MEQLDGRNPVLEALSRKRRRVRRLLVDERAKPQDKLDRILALAKEQGVPVERVPRQELDKKAAGDVHNGVIAFADPLPEMSVSEVIDDCYRRGKDPFIVLADEISYEQNLGAILRSCLGAGVDALVIPTVRGKGLSPVVSRVSMGGAEAVPVVREGLSSALATIRRAGIKVVGADMDGKACWDVDLRGALAVVLGGESKGLSPALRNKCDEIIAVPLAGGLESLNVSVTAGVLFFERVRQTR